MAIAASANMVIRARSARSPRTAAAMSYPPGNASALSLTLSEAEMDVLDTASN